MQSSRWLAGVGVFVALGMGVPRALAQTPMTLPQVLARAREVAPDIVSARLAVEETRSRLVGANLRAQTNPELEFLIGSRTGREDRSTDFDIGVAQWFEPAGRRAARVSAATAAIDRSTAVLEDTTRLVLREATMVYYRTVHAGARLTLLATAESLATATLHAADRRHQAGDIAVLDVNLAKAALARARSERETAAADRLAAIGVLKGLLRLETGIDVANEFGSLALDAPDLASLVEQALQRPELRELDAGIREAEADRRLAQTFTRPEFGAGFTFQGEEGDRIVSGGLTMTLPVFAKGQEAAALGAARSARARSDLEAARERVRIEVDAALAVLDRRREAVRVLEREALPGLDENEALAARSFEVGEIGLPELLLIRRELLDTRFRHLDALLEAAVARVLLDAAAGVLR